MTFKTILNREDTSSEEKLSQLSSLVTKIRTKYDNVDVEIPSDNVLTIDGLVPMAMLDTESRLAVAEQEIDRIVSLAYEDTQSAVGINLDRRLEEYVAISPVLNSIQDSLGSEYL